mmetsp:Transcript_10080/g.23743  ORF Transcript_10080/g.23743 Transcript_10080/m.23743 type:complete len:235 (-) Transcript_10080:307-1011(-)
MEANANTRLEVPVPFEVAEARAAGRHGQRLAHKPTLLASVGEVSLVETGKPTGQLWSQHFVKFAAGLPRADLEDLCKEEALQTLGVKQGEDIPVLPSLQYSSHFALSAIPLVLFLDAPEPHTAQPLTRLWQQFAEASSKLFARTALGVVEHITHYEESCNVRLRANAWLAQGTGDALSQQCCMLRSVFHAIHHHVEDRVARSLQVLEELVKAIKHALVRGHRLDGRRLNPKAWT